MQLSSQSLRRLEASPPASWYFLGLARDVPDQAPRGVRLWGEDLVLFRSTHGLAAVGGRCPHMGADLANGVVRDGALRCPFHAWEFEGQGGCRSAPGLSSPPDFARLPVWPLRERHGLLHVFRGRQPEFPLPFFAGVPEQDMVAARPFRLELACPWWVAGANGFDEQHFANVHGRSTREEPRLEQLNPYACRVVYRFEITGSALQDKVARRLWGSRAELSFTCWGGNVIVGTMRIGSFSSTVLVFVTPLGPGRCAADFVVFRPRRGARAWARLVRPLELTILRRVTQDFFRHEVEAIGKFSLDPERLVETDRLLRSYLEWLVSRPGHQAVAPCPAAAVDS